MADQYNDLYIRSTLTDPGTLPRSTSGLSASPDIIPYGIMPVDNPTTFFTNNFNQVVSKDLLYNAPNYVYLRGQNYYDGARQGQAYAYYCPSNLLLYPSTWRQNVLYNNNGTSDHVNVSSPAKNQPWVTSEPLLWTPAMPPPNTHYCMISRVVTDSHPNPIPNTGSYSDFATWVAGNGGIGWRNVTVVSAGSPEILFNSDYDQGEEPGLMDILITVTDVPIGSEVWFSSSTPLESGKVIAIPPTKITQNPQTWGTQAYIPAEWETVFHGAYRSNGFGPPGPKFDVSLRVQFAPPTTSRLYSLGSNIKDLGFGDWHMFDRRRNEYIHHSEFYRNSARDAFTSGPVRPVLLGAVSVKGQ